jgi:hypothetical protein
VGDTVLNALQFRRSMKGDKADVKAHHISIPPKDAIAIVPPKKVCGNHHHLPSPPSYSLGSDAA